MHCLLCHFSCLVRGSWDIFSRSDVAEALRLQAQHLHLDNQLLRQSHAYGHFSRMYTEQGSSSVCSLCLSLELRKKVGHNTGMDDLECRGVCQTLAAQRRCQALESRSQQLQSLSFSNGWSMGEHFLSYTFMQDMVISDISEVIC